jgi:hypothetical protein
MFKIRKEQKAALSQATLDSFRDRMVLNLKLKFGDKLVASDEALRRSVQIWIQDAERWGLRSERGKIKYVESCVATQGSYQPFETRLVTYLRLYHEPLLPGVDLEKFTSEVVRLGSDHGIREEEGLTWLAAILLAGRRTREVDYSWIHSILSQPDDEESRLQRVHEGAIHRGWIS